MSRRRIRRRGKSGRIGGNDSSLSAMDVLSSTASNPNQQIDKMCNECSDPFVCLT